MNITEFVVGLGLDSDNFKKGMASAIGQVGSFKSTVLQAGAAVAGAFGAKALTIDFAKQNDQLRQMAQYLGMSSDGLYGLSQAARTYGADISEMSSLLQGFNQAKAGMAVGEIGIFQDLAEAGIAIDPLTKAKDAGEMVIKLSEQFEHLNHTQRVNVAKVLGISPQMLDLLSRGRGEVEQLAKKFEGIRPHTKEYEESSRKLNAQLVLLDENVGSVADKLGNTFTKTLGEVVSQTNAWIDANRDVINSGVDGFCDTLAENINAVAIAVGGLAAAGTVATIGQLAKGLGSAGAAASALAAGVSKLILPLTIAAALWETDPSKIFGDGVGKLLNMTPGELWNHLTGDDKKTPDQQKKSAELYEKIGDSGMSDTVDPNSFREPAIAPTGESSSSLTPDKSAAVEGGATSAKASQKEPKVNVNTNVYIGNERIKDIARAESQAVMSEAIDNAFERASQVGDY